mmetsp:Transcript_17002/g.39257  ORF Transcript_17002/g.39257 Transcript_17002/m.39257 type:complete len:115 (+) Transcript_17002:1710-2054(+)
MTNLEFLVLFSNLLSGTIPSELGNTAKLRVLSLVGNRLTGPMPTELGRLTDLEVLGFSSNDLSGSIPDEVCSLWDHNLEFLGIVSSSSRCSGAFGGLSCPSQTCCPMCYGAVRE